MDAVVARYYDPQTAQFLTRDPLEDITGQPYAYAGDDPIDNSDPSGLSCNANPFSGSFWTSGNCLSDNTPDWVPVAGQVKSFASCAGAGGTSVYDCGVMNLDPAYYAIDGYYNEWQAAENGCSLGTVAKYGAEGVLGVASTAGFAVGVAGPEGLSIKVQVGDRGFKLHYDTVPHKNIGWHFQLDRWQRGVPGSGRSSYLPWPPWRQ